MPSEPEDLSEQHGPGDQQQSGQHERPPQKDQGRAARPEALEDLGRGSSQDVRVLEALTEQGEVGVEPERRDDEHHSGGGLDAHAPGRSSRFPDFGSRSEQACEDEPGQQSEDERPARAEDREPLIDVPRDHVRGHDPAKRPGRWVRNGPPHRTRDPISCEHQCLHRPHRETGHRTHEGEVSSADPVIDEGRPRDQADSHPRDRRRDPEPRDPLPQNEPLRRPDDRAHDESTGERCSNGIDSVHDQVCDVPRDREADQDRHYP